MSNPTRHTRMHRLGRLTREQKLLRAKLRGLVRVLARATLLTEPYRAALRAARS